MKFRHVRSPETYFARSARAEKAFDTSPDVNAR
jgi:hypothetical protein